MALRAGYYGIKKKILNKILPDYTDPDVMTNRELTENVFVKNNLSSADNLNDVTTDGIYGIGSAPTNSPESTAYCILIVKRYSGSQLIQVIHKHDVMYSRRYFVSGDTPTWSSWYKFTGTVVS